MSNKETPQETQQFGKRVALVKDLVALFRDLAVFMLALLLLVFPTKLNQILTNAGFEEGSIVGFKWKRGLVESNETLQAAEKTIATLSAQNESLLTALSTAGATSEALKAEFSRLQAENQRIAEDAKRVQTSVTATIESNAPLVGKAVASTGSAPYPDRAYCYQEDRLQDGASRFSVHCHETKERCETARGPSKVWKQTQCELIDLTLARWNPGHPGWMGSWYQFSREPFGEPFPQLK
jgi:hypothetical protein